MHRIGLERKKFCLWIHVNCFIVNRFLFLIYYDGVEFL